MYDSSKDNVSKLIQEIILSRNNDLSWTCDSDYDYDYESQYQYDSKEQTNEEHPSETITILNNIRNLCNTIQTNVINSGTLDESFLMMGLLDVQNKLKEFNDTLNSLQNFNNNQQLLTGDIILQ